MQLYLSYTSHLEYWLSAMGRSERDRDVAWEVIYLARHASYSTTPTSAHVGPGSLQSSGRFFKEFHNFYFNFSLRFSLNPLLKTITSSVLG